MKEHHHRRRAKKRGAIFVESIIVISFFTLCFLGAMFFRDLYVKKARVQRLARASAMSYAENACTGDPKAGLDQDMPPNQPPPSSDQGPPLGNKKTDDKNAAPAVNKFDSTSHGGPFDPVTGITVQTTASATTQSSTGAPKQGFTSPVGSTSYVACMAPTSNDQVAEIFDQIKDTIGSIFH